VSDLEELPVAAEAAGADTVKVEYAGQVYLFPASLDDADGDVLDAVDDQKLSHALRGLMGADDWRRFKATKPKVKHYGELFGAYARTIGMDTVGESSASDS
jgi:hypothetical protein